MQPRQQPTGDTLQPADNDQQIDPSQAAATETHDYLHPIVDQPKHTLNPKHIMIGLGLVVLAALMAVGTMLIVALMPTQRPKSTTKTSTSTTTKVTENALTAKQTIQHVGVYFKGTEAPKTPISMPVMAPGKSFYTVVPDLAPLTSLAGEITLENSDAQLTSILKSLDYDKFDKRVFSDGTNNTNYMAGFSRTDTICQVSVTKSTDTKANHWFEVSCLDMATYAEYADAQQTYASLYTPATSTATLYGFIGKPEPSASKSAGYKLVEVPVGTVIEQRMSATNNRAMYYQTPDGLWHYLKDRTDTIVLECEQYSTPTLKYAYLGQPCRSLAKDTVTTVQPPSKK